MLPVKVVGGDKPKDPWGVFTCKSQEFNYVVQWGPVPKTVCGNRTSLNRATAHVANATFPIGNFTQSVTDKLQLNVVDCD